MIVGILTSLLVAFRTLNRTKLIEKNLLESEERYRFLIENQTDLISRFKPDGKFVFVNDMYCRFFNKSKKELIGTKWEPPTVGDDTQLIKEALSALSPANPTVIIENRVFSGKGQIHWVQFINSGFFDHQGGLLEIQSVGRDITDRKQAEAEIRSAKLFIDRVVDMSPFAMWISDRKGTVIRTNSTLRETLNLPDDKIVGQYNVLNDKNMEIQGVMPKVMAVFENHEPANFSIPWKAAKAGDAKFEGAQDLHIDVSIFPIVSAEGELTNAVCQWVNITEHKKAEEALYESHEKFKSIVDNIGIGIALISPAMEILEMNHQMREWFSEQDLNKRPICYRTFNDPPREEICEYCPICKTLEDGKVHEDTTTTPQGDKTRNYRVVSSPLTNSQGEVIAAIEMVEDITERLNIQAQLIQAQKMESVGLMAGGIAHDFNNILSSIIGFTELALDEVEKDTNIEDSLQEVYAAGMRAKDLVRQILTISRHDEKDVKPIQLTPLIKEALKMLRATIPTSIEFQEDICSESLVVNADATQLHQIIVNMVTNARQAMACGTGVLEIGVDTVRFESDIKNKYLDMQPGNFARITVSDNGMGIPEKSLGKIFEPYFTTKEKGEGTGLGLSVVQGIVKSHNGHITAYSKPGKGTTFHVYLPLIKKASVELPDNVSEPLPIGTERVLLVDDEPSIVKMQQQNLERMGYTVTTKINSMDALEAFRASAGKYDLVITDMTMPKMTGDKLAQEIKAIRSNIPVILCTGFSEKINDHGESQDIDGFLMKPVDKTKMLKTVRKVLDEAKKKR